MAAHVILFQQAAEAESTPALLAWFDTLGWVDRTALGVLLVFFVLGLFKGLVWQVSRIGILLAAYVVSGRFGHDVAEMLSRGEPADEATGVAASAPSETTIYLAYCLLFVAVLVVLSLLAMLIKKLVDKAGLGFFDRLGGGLFGVVTGAAVVLALVFVVHMFFPQSKIAKAAEQSHSLQWSKQAIDWLEDLVHDDLRTVLSLPPLTDPAFPPDRFEGDRFEGGGLERGGRNDNGLATPPGEPRFDELPFEMPGREPDATGDRRGIR